MNLRKLHAAALLILAGLLVAPRAALAAEGYGNCNGVIASVPVVISTAGTWCLKQNLSTSIASGDAIAIQADNVTLDCNDFKLIGTATLTTTQAYGVYTPGRYNATVRHCNIRGFEFGVNLSSNDGKGGHVVEDNRFDGNAYTAIHVEGDGSIVRRNQVFDTGGTTVLGANSPATGLSVLYSVNVLDNTVSGVNAAGSATGIYTGSSSADISGNRIRGLQKGANYASYGINNNDPGRLILRNNDLVGDGNAFSVGLSCANGNARAKDNVLSGFATAISGCSNSGGNVIKP